MHNSLDKYGIIKQHYRSANIQLFNKCRGQTEKKKRSASLKTIDNYTDVL